MATTAETGVSGYDTSGQRPPDTAQQGDITTVQQMLDLVANGTFIGVTPELIVGLTGEIEELLIGCGEQSPSFGIGVSGVYIQGDGGILSIIPQGLSCIRKGANELFPIISNPDLLNTDAARLLAMSTFDANYYSLLVPPPDIEGRRVPSLPNVLTVQGVTILPEGSQVGFPYGAQVPSVQLLTLGELESLVEGIFREEGACEFTISGDLKSGSFHLEVTFPNGTKATLQICRTEIYRGVNDLKIGDVGSIPAGDEQFLSPNNYRPDNRPETTPLDVARALELTDANGIEITLDKYQFEPDGSITIGGPVFTEATNFTTGKVETLQIGGGDWVISMAFSDRMYPEDFSLPAVALVGALLVAAGLVVYRNWRTRIGAATSRPPTQPRQLRKKLVVGHQAVKIAPNTSGVGSRSIFADETEPVEEILPTMQISLDGQLVTVTPDSLREKVRAGLAILFPLDAVRITRSASEIDYILWDCLPEILNRGHVDAIELKSITGISQNRLSVAYDDNGNPTLSYRLVAGHKNIKGGGNGILLMSAEPSGVCTIGYIAEPTTERTSQPTINVAKFVENGSISSQDEALTGRTFALVSIIKAQLQGLPPEGTGAVRQFTSDSEVMQQAIDQMAPEIDLAVRYDDNIVAEQMDGYRQSITGIVVRYALGLVKTDSKTQESFTQSALAWLNQVTSDGYTIIAGSQYKSWVGRRQFRLHLVRAERNGIRRVFAFLSKHNHNSAN